MEHFRCWDYDTQLTTTNTTTHVPQHHYQYYNHLHFSRDIPHHVWLSKIEIVGAGL